MTIEKKLPVLLLTGYLGSGKTTLLNNILNNRRGIRFAVIVNDIGEVNIDASLIAREGIVGLNGNKDDLVALQNGCICCTLQTDLIDQLCRLARAEVFDYIVIEASGICEPEPIAQTIDMIARTDEAATLPVVPVLDNIVTVVDALRLKDEFGCGESLVSERSDDDIENLVIEQIEFCNIILLNKVSEVTPDETRHIKAIIRAIQPRAEIIDCNYCDVDIDCLLDTANFEYGKVATSATWLSRLEAPLDHDDHDHDEHGHHHGHHDHDDEHHDCHCHEHGHDCHCHHHHHHDGEAAEYGIMTMVYFARRPFDLNRFDRYLATEWPKNIIRAKGLIYFAHNRDMSYIFETAGRQKKLTQAGLWYATAPAEELAQMMLADPSLSRDWDDVYGDRMIKLVIIGRHLDRDAITASLDNCVARF